MTFKARTRAGVRIALVFIVVLAVSPLAQERWAEDLAQPLDYVPGEILVKFHPDTPPGLVNQARQHLSARHMKTFARIGVQHWRTGRGVSTEQALAALASPPYRDFVDYAEPNYIRHSVQAYPDDPLRGDMWALHNIGQTGGTRGADIGALGTWDASQRGTPPPTVAVIDTGVDYTHPDLEANIWSDDAGAHGYDFVNNDGDPVDDEGHGTHVAGTIGAIGNNGIGMMGVSWQARIMAVKFLNASGSGTDANAILAINYARDNGATIMNASWGGTRRSQALSDAIATCNCLFVAAAGNGRTSKAFYPAGYDLPNIISVAATDHSDALAAFSNYSSTWVDLAAPGVNILSTYVGGGYATMSGTSMAAPHVSGVAALLLANTPSLNTSELKTKILDGADRLPSLQSKVLTGGRLNAAKPLNLTWPPPEDPTAPGSVSNLTAAPSQDSLTISWVAGGDDGNTGIAYVYDLRYSTSTIDGSNWASATPATGEPLPAGPGSGQSYVLGDLDASTTYYVGLKVADESGNFSALATTSAQTLPGPKWTVESIQDGLGSNGFYHALAFDSEGNPAVAYSGANSLVMFAINLSGTGWHFSTADSGSAGIDLALDANNQPAISHAWGKLRFAEGTVNGASWQSSVLESGPRDDVTSLVFKDGEPWIAYRGGGRTLRQKLIHRQGTSWITETVDSAGGGRYVSLAFDGSGNPSLAYSDDIDGDNWIDTLKFARWNGNSWSVEIIETGVIGYGVHASLAYDRHWNPTIVHSANGAVRFVHQVLGEWVAEVVASGGDSSLAFDPADGLPTVAYSTNDSRVAWAKRIGAGQWQVERVDRNAEVIWVTCLKFDLWGNPWILYHDYATDTLRLARRVPL